jgi:hypothetical protein
VIDAGDRLAIHELLGLYGHLIDERRWNEMELVFTDDVTFDATDFGNGVTQSLEELRAFWTSDPGMHPLAHHVTNVVVGEEADGTVRVVSKAFVVGRKGRVGSGVYRDVVVRTPAGWRIGHRRAEARRP